MKIAFSKITELLKDLPNDIKSVIFSPEIGEKIYSIGIENNLDDNQCAVLKDLVTYMLFGFIKKESFPETLRKEMGIDLLASETIAKKIDGLISPKIHQINPVNNIATNDFDILKDQKNSLFNLIKK